MTIVNSLNFPNLPLKGSPTTSDILLISDQAASGALKQTTIGDLPAPVIAIPQPVAGGPGVLCLPGMFNNVVSDNLTVSLDMNSQVLFMPFYINNATTTANMRLYIKTGLSASTATMGIYASNTSGTYKDLPTGAPLATCQTSTSSSSSDPTPALVVSLSANTLYWGAVQVSSASILAVQVVQMNITPGSVPGVVSFSNSSYGTTVQAYSNVYSAGTLPTVTSSSVSGTYSNAPGYAPILQLF